MVPARIGNTQPLGLHSGQQLVEEVNQTTPVVLGPGKLHRQVRYVVQPQLEVVWLWVKPGKVSGHQSPQASPQLKVVHALQQTWFHISIGMRYSKHINCLGILEASITQDDTYSYGWLVGWLVGVSGLMTSTWRQADKNHAG